MSERVANAEIEDVLMSIRRLVQGDSGTVSNDDQAEQDDAGPFRRLESTPVSEDPDEFDEASSASERKSLPAEALVLTPALRVDGLHQQEAAEPGEPSTDDLRFLAEEPPVDSPTSGARFHFEPAFEDHARESEESETWGDPDSETGPEGYFHGSRDGGSGLGGAERHVPEASRRTQDESDVPSFVRAVVGDLSRLKRDQEFDLEPMAKPTPTFPAVSGSEAESDGPFDLEAADEPGAAERSLSRTSPRAGFHFGEEEDETLQDVGSLQGTEDEHAMFEEEVAEDAASAEADPETRFDGEEHERDDLLASIVNTIDEMELDYQDELSEQGDLAEHDLPEEDEIAEPDAPVEDVAEADVTDPSEVEVVDVAEAEVEDVAEAEDVASSVDVTETSLNPDLEAAEPGAERSPEVAPFRVVEGVEATDETSAEPGADALDEAALADLIAECVHRELQGELGERITRNVRKLVRREIHRALAMRDFD